MNRAGAVDPGTGRAIVDFFSFSIYKYYEIFLIKKTYFSF